VPRAEGRESTITQIKLFFIVLVAKEMGKTRRPVFNLLETPQGFLLLSVLLRPKLIQQGIWHETTGGQSS
jgi:hypothetical protein